MGVNGPGCSFVPEAYHYPPLVEQGTWLWYLILADTFITAVYASFISMG